MNVSNQTMVDKVSVVRYTFANEKFELLVKPDPAFDYKLGKISEISKILVSDEIYTAVSYTHLTLPTNREV